MPQPDGPAPPERLLRFKPSEWGVRPRRTEAEQWREVFRVRRKWLAARKAWEAESTQRLPKSWERDVTGRG